MRDQLLSFDDEQRRRGAYARCDGGIQIVPIGRIVGSVGRARDFNERFEYRQGLEHGSWDAAMRLRRLRVLFQHGQIPPVELYLIGNDFFVLDGHHRVAIARQMGLDYLDAHVIEYQPAPNDPSAVTFRERQSFARETGLHQVFATEPGRYPRLLSRVQNYHRGLVQWTGRGGVGSEPRLRSLAPPTPGAMPSLRDAARDWFKSEFQPVVTRLRAEGAARVFPGRGLGDLYGYVSDHRWYLSEQTGWDVGLERALMDFVDRFILGSITDRAS